jgi:hypothetical protein
VTRGDEPGPLTLYARECLTPEQKLQKANIEAAEPYPDLFRSNLRTFWDAQAEWSQKTFGEDRRKGPLGALKHLEKETKEARRELEDAEFYDEMSRTVDCPVGRAYYAALAAETRAKALVELSDHVFLIFDATRRAGFTFDQLVKACWDKLEVNKARDWPPPRYDDEPVEHDRTKETT